MRAALEGKSTLTSVKRLRVNINDCVRNVAVSCLTLIHLLLFFSVMITTPLFFHLCSVCLYFLGHSAHL